LLGFMLFSDGKGGGLPVLLRPETGTLRVGASEAPFAISDLAAGENIELCIFIDKYLVEVFANGRQTLVSAHLEHAGRRGLDGFTVGAPTTLKSVQIWKLKPTNEGFREAQKNPVWQPAGAP
jgi:beta-fructofuranosidase